MPTRLMTISAIALMTFGLGSCASPNWPTYRYTSLRGGAQPAATVLSNPARVPTLAVRWTFTPPNGEGGSFYASPIVVHNRGKSIAPAELATIFDPFRRSSRPRTSVGLGLGLFIAHEIARTHGGKMWATSCAEEGTQFSALLPRRI